MPVYVTGGTRDNLHEDSPHIVHVTSREIANGRKNLAEETNSYKVLLDYLNEIGVSMGKSKFEDDKEIVVEKGVCNDLETRIKVNTLFYYNANKMMPPFPWAFDTKNLMARGFFN